MARLMKQYKQKITELLRLKNEPKNHKNIKPNQQFIDSYEKQVVHVKPLSSFWVSLWPPM